ncbi:MAG: metal-dependent transcriptional regulator [Candidatus Kapabacteria bacterium]|nr:metal-dependent transcriptional regulator [Ignavibacteriota bacterium]MCW5884941.1 metal-dependent transcriptional regulator [Candidatus Kapabacteria bacterium]
MKEKKARTQSIEDYLKTIYKLQAHEKPVSTTSIANELEFSGASVTGMLKRLSEMESKRKKGALLVDYNSYKGVTLTEEGEFEALSILRRHRLIEMFLKNHVGYALSKVHDEACAMEHAVSDEFVDKIDKLLGHPKYSPLGNPIPDKDGNLPEDNSLPLTVVELNKTYVIKKISDDNHEMIAYFEDQGYLPGLEIMLMSRAPFNGPIVIIHNDKESIIGHEIGKNIYVEAI